MSQTTVMIEPARWTLKQIADYIGAELHGEEDYLISGLNTLQEAGEGELSFLANPAYQRFLSSTCAGAVILKPTLADAFAGNKLLLDNPYLGYAKLSELFDASTKPSQGIHPSAVVDDTASLADNVCIGANVTVGAYVELGEGVVVGAGCVIGDYTRLGADTRLHPNVTLAHGVTIGADCLLQSGCVIGGDGFGFAPSDAGWVKIHQLGGVVIGDRVEIGACTTVDRGALGDTVINDGVIIDNQVQIAHNVRVGENTAIAGCTAIAGSTVIGRNCIIAGAVSIVGHLEIVDNVQISAMSLVSRSITKPGSYSSGTVVSDSKTWRKNAVRFNQLDKIATRLAAVEKVQAASRSDDK